MLRLVFWVNINHVGEEIRAREVLTLFLIFEHFTVKFLYFLTPPNYGGKLNIYEPLTPVFDEVWFRPLYIKISCLDHLIFRVVRWISLSKSENNKKSDEY